MDSTQQWVPESEAAELLAIKQNTLRTMRRDGRLEPGAHWIYATGTAGGPVTYNLQAIRQALAERTVQMVQEKAKQLETARKARKAAVEIYGDDAMDQLIADVRN